MGTPGSAQAAEPTMRAPLVLSTSSDVYGAQAQTPSEPVREKSLADFVFDPFTEPPKREQIYEGFLSPGDVTVWIGREKHRKSNLTEQFAICAATGRPFLCFRYLSPQDVRVVIVDYETTSASLWQRYVGICQAMNLTDQEKKRLADNLKIIEVRRAYQQGFNFPPIPIHTGSSYADAPEKFWRQLVSDYPAEIYVIDPLRCSHAADENDSRIAELLATMRQIFGRASVTLPHHMRKPGIEAGGKSATLLQDMRGWSDGARGSTAIKAHADVIVCQERMIEADDEVVYLGAFLKDGADIEPMALEESDANSFFWQPRPEIPAHLRRSFDALEKRGTDFRDEAAVIRTMREAGTKKTTAYRHVAELRRLGLLAESGTVLQVRRPSRPEGGLVGNDEQPTRNQ